MVHRLALAAGGFTAAGILVLALTAGSLAHGPGRALESAIAAAPTAPATTRTQVDTVYVAPVPKPKVIHVTRVAGPKKSTQRTDPLPVNPERDDDRSEGSERGEREGGD